MSTESYSRRSTDRGYTAPKGYKLQALRGVLGLVPVNEALPALQHWRRRPAKNES